MLEASCHDCNSFVTLTYDDAAVPEDGSVKPEHLRNWLKRFRKRQQERYPWRRLRFYAVGEYGDQSGRPHYHCALFGFSCELVGERDCQCLSCCDVRETWGLGHVLVQRLVPATAQYVCGYVTKKLERNSGWLKGRHPEFSRMSLRPGIGANAMWDVASVIQQYSYERMGIPSVLSHGSSSLVLGRYLRKKLQMMIGEEGALPTNKKLESELQLVQDFAWANSTSIRKVFFELNEAHASQLAQKAATKARVL